MEQNPENPPPAQPDSSPVETPQPPPSDQPPSSQPKSALPESNQNLQPEPSQSSKINSSSNPEQQQKPNLHTAAQTLRSKLFRIERDAIREQRMAELIVSKVGSHSSRNLSPSTKNSEIDCTLSRFNYYNKRYRFQKASPCVYVDPESSASRMRNTVKSMVVEAADLRFLQTDNPSKYQKEQPAYLSQRTPAKNNQDTNQLLRTLIDRVANLERQLSKQKEGSYFRYSHLVNKRIQCRR